MEIPVVNKLAAIGRSPWYWLALLLLGLAMEGMALFYQHVLGYGPCVLCIQVRLWLLGLVLVALAALVMRRSRLGLVAAHALSALVLAGMLERAWRLLGIERGTVEGECSFDLGLPAWLPLDHWFPPHGYRWTTGFRRCSRCRKPVVIRRHCRSASAWRRSCRCSAPCCCC